MENTDVTVPKSTEINRCAANGCTMETDDLMIKCHECKLHTHFKCTKLPVYQLFIYKTGKRRYICELCTGSIPDDFLKQVNQVITGSNLEDVIKSLQKSVATKTEESKGFLEKATELKLQNTHLKQQIKDMEGEHAVLTKKINDHDKSVGSPRTSKKVTERDLLKSIENLLEKKLVIVEERLKQSVIKELDNNKKIMDDKLDTVIKDNKSYAESVKGSIKVNEAVSSEMTNFKSILEQAKNDELIEEREKQKRSNNFIIHGLEENGTDVDAVNNNDAKLINLFFGTINIEARPTKFYRLGKITPNKNRPLKLEMTNKSERDEVMNNLNCLKGSEEILGKLSVKEDLTKNEREQVQKYVEMAKEKNAENSSHHWVVRGTPKNGLRLVMFTRR